MDLLNVLDTVSANDFCKTVPDGVANIVHMIYLGIQILVPLLLIIFGSIDLAKSLTAGKEDEIKKAQAGLIKKVIVAVIVFLLMTITQWVVNLAGTANGDDDNSTWKCACKLLTGKDCK